MVNHHPDSNVLNEFSAGTLTTAQAICVSLHLNYCTQCQRDHLRLQQLGASLFSELAPQAVDDSLRHEVMSHLDDEAPLSYRRCRADEPGGPGLLQKLMAGDYDELAWSRAAPALHVSRLPTGDPDHELALYHIRAGGSIPEHTHRGSELTLVLEGSFSDEEGVYREGDFLMRDAAHRHTPTASMSGDCICVGVLDAPIRFTRWHYRALNPLLRIHTG